jgi:integrase
MTQRYRGHGEGSISERPNRSKKYLAQIYARGKRFSKSFQTRTEAIAWLRTIQQQLRGTTYSELVFSHLDNGLAIWMNSNRSHWHDKTYQSYQRIINQFINPNLGNKRVVDIHPADIQQLIDDIRITASDRNMLFVKQVLSSFFGFLLKQGLITFNPAKTIARSKYEPNFQYLNSEQTSAFLATAKNLSDPLVDFYFLAISTGMREGELLGLRWSNIDWASNSILVREQVQWPGKKITQGSAFVFQSPKTKQSRRRIILGPLSMERLRQQQQRVTLTHQFAGSRWQEFNLVFPSALGTPMEPTNLIRRFKKLLKIAELPDIRIHDLRHTSATLLLLRGVNPKVVCERLGHVDISTTLQIYSHVLPSLQANAAILIDDQLEKTSEFPTKSLDAGELTDFERGIYPG